MIPYIANRLQEWAEWSRMRMDGYYGMGGGGFAYDEPMPTQDRGMFKMHSSLRCIETEEGVAWLRLENVRIGDCVICHYRDRATWSAQLQADFLGLNLRTYWRRLETAHGLLLGYFLDRAVGLLPQTEGLRLDQRKRRSESTT